MNRYSKLLFVLLIIFFGLGKTYSQSTDSTDFISVIARAHKDSVVIRWAPSGPAAWKLLNKYGYMVERYTILKGKEVLAEKPMVELSKQVIPAPEKEWLQWINQDDFVAVAAQSIFGEEFGVDTKDTELMSIYNQVRELESRYSFGLFSADLSSRAAQLSGLRWVDHSVKEDEMYLYKIISLVPEENLKISFGYAYSGPSKEIPLPVPAAPEVESVSGSSVLIRWETEKLASLYVAYTLEKSFDDKVYQKVNQIPMSIMDPKIENGKRYAAKSDTLVVGQKVYYRVKGRDSFGEEGPASESLVFTGEMEFNVNPVVIKAALITPSNTQVKISWEFEAESQSILNGFDVERSNQIEGQFAVISKTRLEKNVREFIDPSPMSTSYYRVVAVSEKGKRNKSFAHLVQLPDSIPPAAPKGLVIQVDTTGLATLYWEKNSESDLLGYRVFRSSLKNSEFSQVTVSPIVENIFVDAVNIKTLSNKMFYKLVAVDTRFNSSIYSEVIRVTLPDIIPPVPPVIKNFRNERDSVVIDWIGSSSTDVAEHQILRKGMTSSNWELVAKVHLDSPNHFAGLVSAGDVFLYNVMAVDSSGLRAGIAKPFIVRGVVSERIWDPKVKISADRINKRVHLSWAPDPQNKIVKYMIYRSLESEPLVLYKSIRSPEVTFSDPNVLMDTYYLYRIKAVFDDGSESRFSDQIQIKY